MKIKFLLSRDRRNHLQSTARVGAILKNGFTIAGKFYALACASRRRGRLITRSQIEGRSVARRECQRG